jgi:hypothetical protein
MLGANLPLGVGGSTSVAMIERHYGHLRGDIAATALTQLAI